MASLWRLQNHVPIKIIVSQSEVEVYTKHQDLTQASKHHKQKRMSLVATEASD